MDFNSLVEIRNRYIKSNKIIDIFGELGQNIFNEGEKIDQLIKYRKIIYNINHLIKINAQEVEQIPEKFKMKKNNKKLVFLRKKSEIIKNMDFNFNELEKIKLHENIKCEFEINIILLHEKKENINKNIFTDLNYGKIKIEVYYLDFDSEELNFNSFEKIKSVLIQKKIKKFTYFHIQLQRIYLFKQAFKKFNY